MYIPGVEGASITISATITADSDNSRSAACLIAITSSVKITLLDVSHLNWRGFL
jgi:hypothetical protein